MQPNKAYNSKNMTMVMPYHPHPNPHPHPHPHHEYLLSNSNSGSSGVEKGTSTGGGSLFSNTISNQFASMSNNIYDVVGADVSSVMQTSLSFASSAGGMTNVNVRVPFTTAQRQELQRQTTIYKYIISSVPVPHQLLVPISNSTAPSNQSTQVKGGSLELGISNSCTDPEPWRCRRTDGKKWRCSRDVILDQKYCERHSHKCRSRSRKPVELNHHFNYNNNSSNNSPYSKSNFLNLGDKDKNKNNNNNHQSSSSISSTGVPISATSHDQFRGLEWFMKGENFPFVGSNQELQQMMNAKLGLSRDANDCDPNIGIPKQQEQHEKVFFNLCGDDQSSLLVIPKLTPFELGTPSTHQTTQETRHFIDAWSTPVTERDHHHVGGDFGNGCCGSSSNEELSFSSLTLAMCGGNDYETNNDHENQNVERGFGHFGNMGSEGSEQVENMKSDQSQWFNPVSWMGSAPGGPLAEALCLGIAGSTREPSSRGCNSSGTTSSRSSC